MDSRNNLAEDSDISTLNTSTAFLNQNSHINRNSAGGLTNFITITSLENGVNFPTNILPLASMDLIHQQVCSIYVSQVVIFCMKFSSVRIQLVPFQTNNLTCFLLRIPRTLIQQLIWQQLYLQEQGRMHPITIHTRFSRI